MYEFRNKAKTKSKLYEKSLRKNDKASINYFRIYSNGNNKYV